MLILALHDQSHAGVATAIQGELADLAHLQALVPERRPFVEAGQIVGLQHQLDAARLLLAAQGHGLDPLARHIVEANGRARQQAIRMLDAAGAEGDALPHQTAVAGDPKRLLRVDQCAHHPALVGEANGVDAADLDAFKQDGHPLLDGQIPAWMSIRSPRAASASPL